MPYRNYHVYVYEGLGEGTNGTHYFYTPVVLLEPETAEYMERKHAVSFSVTMWNREVENAVLDHVKNRPKTDAFQVKPMPFDKIRLTCKASSDAFELPNEWQSYQLHREKRFHLICPTREEAESVAEAMKTQPRR